MSVFNRLHKRISREGVPPIANTFNPEDHIPEEKHHIIHAVLGKFGIDLDSRPSGEQMNAIKTITGALIVQRECSAVPELFAQSEAIIISTQPLLGFGKVPREENTRALESGITYVGGMPISNPEIAETILKYISKQVDEYYAPPKLVDAPELGPPIPIQPLNQDLQPNSAVA